MYRSVVAVDVYLGHARDLGKACPAAVLRDRPLDVVSCVGVGLEPGRESGTLFQSLGTSILGWEWRCGRSG